MNADAADREQRLNQVLLAYIDAEQAGRLPPRGKLLIDHPEFAEELIEFVGGRRQLDRLAGCLREAPRPSRPTDSAAPELWPLAPGTERGVIGDFRIVREVGRGGMGIV